MESKAPVYEYLSFGDALFLFLEREVAPLNIAAVATFSGHIDLASFTSCMEHKLPQLPRFRQKVVGAPFNIGLPHWEVDAKFDIRNHVREIRLKRGTDEEFRSAASRILSVAMDRNRPLWDFTLVHGLKDRTGLIIRLHHALSDGVSGVSMLKVLLSERPEAPPQVRPAKRSAKTAAPDPLTMVFSDVANWWFGSVERMLTMERDLFQMAERAVAANKNGARNGNHDAAQKSGARIPQLDALSSLAPELGAPAARFPFNKICQGPQKFVWAKIPFARIHAVKKLCGVTVNDVMLTVVSCAYRDYARAMAPSQPPSMRIVIPVNKRNGSEEELGNQITFAPVDVPTSIRDVRRLLEDVHHRTQMMKSTGLAELVAFAGTALGLVPPPVQAALATLASQLPISLCNVIFTNVPGPQQPLYFMRHELLECYPYVPIGGEMALNCAALTYNGTAYFGFSADAAIAANIEKIAEALIANFELLEKKLGLKKAVAPRAQRPVARKQTRVVKKVVARKRRTKVSPPEFEVAAPPVEPVLEQLPIASEPIIEFEPAAPDEMTMAAGAGR